MYFTETSGPKVSMAGMEPIGEFRRYCCGHIPPNSPANDTTLRSDELELRRDGSRVLAARRLPLPLPASDCDVLLPAEEHSLRPRRPQGAWSAWRPQNPADIPPAQRCRRGQGRHRPRRRPRKVLIPAATLLPLNSFPSIRFMSL
jgi:hypothetical protein